MIIRRFFLAVLVICFFALGSGCSQKTQPAQTDNQAESAGVPADSEGAALQKDNAEPNADQAGNQAEAGDTAAPDPSAQAEDNGDDAGLADDIPLPLPVEEKHDTVGEPPTDDEEIDLLRLPRAIREQIEKDVKGMPAISMDDILKQEDPDKRYQYILDHLQKNPCQANSEDFVISSDDNTMIFQTKLEQVRYKELYDKLYEKHLKEKSCKGNRELTQWGGYLFSGMPEKDLATGQIGFPKSKSCSNGEYKDMTHLLDINPWIYIQEFDGKMESITGGLIWSNFFLNREKFQDDFTMDTNLIIGIDDKISKGENLTYKYHGSLGFAKSSAAYVDEILENMLRGSEFHVVYGRFIPVDNKYYYILSFRTYSLTDMRKECPFLNNYITHQYDSGPKTLRALQNRPKTANSNNQPRRVRVDLDDETARNLKNNEDRPKDTMVGLPFAGDSDEENAKDLNNKEKDKKAKDNRPRDNKIDLPF